MHFGVYTVRGPVDPLPFVDKVVKKPVAVPQKPLVGYLRLTRAAEGGLIKPNTVVIPLAVGTKGYLAALPDGTVLELPFAGVQAATKPIKSEAATARVPLLHAPLPDVVPTGWISQGSQVEVLGYFDEYALVRASGVEGWMFQG